MNRREFLKASAATAAGGLAPPIARGGTPATEEAHGLGAEDATASKNASRGPHLRVMLKEADDAPLDHERARLLIARDLASDAFPVPIDEQRGVTFVGLAKEPLQICVRL